MVRKNSRIGGAYVYKCQRAGDTFVLAQLKYSDGNGLEEDPRFLRIKCIGAIPVRTGSYGDALERDIIYRAETNQQAERLLKAFECGDAFRVNHQPVMFKILSDLGGVPGFANLLNYL